MWFYPEEAQAQPCLLNIRATMLSLLEDQVPGWHDSPQMEPKGWLAAGRASGVDGRGGSESACPPEFHIHKDVTCVNMS